MTTPELRRLRSRIEDRQAKVVVVGQGYVGLPLAMRAVEVAYPVVGYDVTPTRIEELRAGRSYVEDVPDTQLAEALRAGYLPSCDVDDLRDFDIAVITVQTPLNEGTPDLSFIESAGRDLARFLSPGALVVLESTTYPGTTEELLRPILEAGGLRADIDFFVGYSPERIDPGNTAWTFASTPKVVSGVGANSLSAVLDNVTHRSAGTGGVDTLTSPVDRESVVKFLLSIDSEAPAFP